MSENTTRVLEFLSKALVSSSKSPNQIEKDAWNSKNNKYLRLEKGHLSEKRMQIIADMKVHFGKHRATKDW